MAYHIVWDGCYSHLLKCDHASCYRSLEEARAALLRDLRRERDDYNDVIRRVRKVRTNELSTFDPRYDI